MMIEGDDEEVDFCKAIKEGILSNLQDGFVMMMMIRSWCRDGGRVKEEKRAAGAAGAFCMRSEREWERMEMHGELSLSHSHSALPSHFWLAKSSTLYSVAWTGSVARSTVADQLRRGTADVGMFG